MSLKTTKPIIEIKDVWKTYRMGKTEVHALQGLNLEIREGEFVAIQGPSGSGKSTAMNMVGCLDVPSKGTIKLDGVDISKLSESGLSQIRGKKIGFIFQKYNLIPTLNAAENVMLPMMFQNTTYDARFKRANDLLKLVELDHRYDHVPAEMSGGQQQRVAIARSLANDPQVLLCDEPTGNLDSKTGQLVMDFLQNLNKKYKKTIVMVTHDDKLAKLADRIEHLKDGKIIKTIQNTKR